ncbi:MAG TPA: DUF4142 domain-containing protein [Gemmatimonadaceae bacterium]|nr:DUF4142 domain-containing protein [Gemmatimonadaceae bacterium]
MSHRTPGVRAAAALLAAAVVFAAACTERDNKAVVGDSVVRTDSGLGIIDTAPATVAQGVAVMLTDENIFALLDTTYALSMQMDSLARARAADPRVKAYAARSMQDDQLLRRGALAERDRLSITPALPDKDPIEDHAKAMRELSGKSGKEFDEAYLDRSIGMHQELLDEVDDALEGRTTGPVRTFLRQARANIEGDVKSAKALKDSIGT